MRISNMLVGRTLALVGEHIKEGVTTAELDKLAEQFIRDNGAIPAFKGYGGFPGSLCTSVNEVVVHGIPSDKTVLRNGDIVSIDCGTIINGFVGDSAYTFTVGEIAESTARLLRVTREALYEGIASAKVGNRIGDVSYAVQSHCSASGFGIVREMVGHGIGRVMHEEPQVPNYGRSGTGPKIVEGMVICIEPMITEGAHNVVFEKDGWTCRTRDRKPAAHFEHCVAIVEGRAEILSSFDFIEVVKPLKSANFDTKFDGLPEKETV